MQHNGTGAAEHVLPDGTYYWSEMSNVHCRFVIATIMALSVAACSDPRPVVAPEPVSVAPQFASGSVAPIECPVHTTQSASATIGPLGGTLAVGGTVVMIPAGALLVPETFTLTIPASNYMEVDVTAGSAQHFEFLSPISVSIDYSRCTRTNIDKAPLSVWFWDGVTLLENMKGTDDKATRTMTFGTSHLSGYVIAD